MDLTIALDTVPLSGTDAPPSTGVPQFLTDGSTELSIPATQWPAYQAQAIITEILNVIAASGQTASRFNTAQLLTAIQTLGVIFVPDTGSANAMNITLATPMATVAGYVGRCFVITKNNTSNTGAITITVNLQSGTATCPVVTSAQAAFGTNQWGAGEVAIVAVGRLHGAVVFQVLSEVGQYSQGQWILVASAPSNPLAPDAYLMDTRAGGFTAQLQASPNQGDNIQFRDPFNAWGAHPLVIDPQSWTINGQSGLMTFNNPGMDFSLVADAGNNWVMNFDA